VGEKGVKPRANANVIEEIDVIVDEGNEFGVDEWSRRVACCCRAAVLVEAHLRPYHWRLRAVINDDSSICCADTSELRSNDCDVFQGQLR
tara:strand:+ start:2956 stop:3225 length:270 start_codon:yes stop_codon:yes gene_type:complete